MMNKAEDRAKVLYPDWEMTGVSTVDGIECSMVRIQRVAYIKGYKQAEKDNELTWENMMLLEDILEEMLGENMNDKIPKEWGIKEYYQEVLRRFKERR